VVVRISGEPVVDVAAGTVVVDEVLVEVELLVEVDVLVEVLVLVDVDVLVLELVLVDDVNTDESFDA
jgi:hypothetical protein